MRRSIVRNGPSFALHLVFAPMTSRDALSKMLAVSDGFPRALIAPLGSGCAPFIADLLRGTLERQDGVIVPDADALLLPSGRDALDALNLSRDRLYELVSGPLILCVLPEHDALLRTAAPDLVSITATATTLDVAEAQRVSASPPRR